MALRVVEELSQGFGAVVIRGVASPEDLRRIKAGFEEALAEAAPAGSQAVRTPGAAANGMTKVSGLCQSSAAFDARLVARPVFETLYGASDLVTSLDTVFWIAPHHNRKRTELHLHYDYSDHPDSVCQQLVQALAKSGYPLVEVLQGILTVVASGETGTVLAAEGVNHPSARDATVKRAFQQTPEAGRRLTGIVPTEPGDLLLFNSRLAHKAVTGEGHVERLAFPVCWVPASVVPPAARVAKRKVFDMGSCTTHWPHAAVRAGGKDSRYNHKRSRNYWKPIEQTRMDPESAKAML